MSIETDLAYVKQVLDRTRKSVLIDTLPLLVWGLLTVGWLCSQVRGASVLTVSGYG